MKNMIHWLLIGIVVVAVVAFVVWLFSFAWKFFLSVALVAIFVMTCNWYFGRKYGNY